MNNLRQWIRLIETNGGFADDPRFQFHLSVEPNLKPMKSFAEQTREISQHGARGDAGDGGDQIYTTHNLQYWATQFYYEEVGDFPEFVYLVFVRNTGQGSVLSLCLPESEPFQRVTTCQTML